MSVLQAERLSDGMVRLDPLYIAVDVDNFGELDAVGARVLVAHLPAAIDRIEKITA